VSVASVTAGYGDQFRGFTCFLEEWGFGVDDVDVVDDVTVVVGGIVIVDAIVVIATVVGFASNDRLRLDIKNICLLNDSKTIFFFNRVRFRFDENVVNRDLVSRGN